MSALDKFLAGMSIADRNAYLDHLAMELAEREREEMLAWDEDYGWQDGQDHYERGFFNQ